MVRITIRILKQFLISFLKKWMKVKVKTLETWVHLLGKNIDTDEVSDDGTKAQNRHGNPFYPKWTALYCAVHLHIQMPTLAEVHDIDRFFDIGFKGFKVFHFLTWWRIADNWRGLDDARSTSSLLKKELLLSEFRLRQLPEKTTSGLFALSAFSSSSVAKLIKTL